MTYNTTRENKTLLDRHRNAPASLSVQLHHDHWTLNSGSKLQYTSPAAAFLDDIRAYRIPVDLLQLIDSANVPYYEGCLVVELQDFREPPATKDKKGEEAIVKSEGPASLRVVLRPNSESAWADLRLLNDKFDAKWTDQEALEVEAKVLLATAPPLCLKPDPNLGRMANTMQRISIPRTPPPLRPQKRKLEASEADERATARKVKILQYMDPQRNRAAKPSQQFWDTVQRITKEHKDREEGARTIPEEADEAVAPDEIATPRPEATPAPAGAETRPHPTPVKSEVARSTTGTPVPAIPARATPQVAAAAAVQAANRQITPRPGSTVPNPAVAAYGATQAAQAAQAIHAAATSRSASQAPPAQANNPLAGLAPQQVANLHHQARLTIHAQHHSRRQQIAVFKERKTRGESLSVDEERMLQFGLHVARAEKVMSDGKQSGDPTVAAEAVKQYGLIMNPLIQQQIRVMVNAHNQKLAAQGQAAAQGQGPTQSQSQAPNHPQPPAPVPTPAPAATPVMAHNQVQNHNAPPAHNQTQTHHPAQPHNPAQIHQAQAQALAHPGQAQILAQAHAAQAQAHAQPHNGHPHAPTQQPQMTQQQFQMYQQQRLAAQMQQAQQQQQQHQAAAANAMLTGTPAQAHAQLPNGASPMFASRQPAAAPGVARAAPYPGLDPAQIQQLMQMGRDNDPRYRAYMQSHPQAASWFAYQHQRQIAQAQAQAAAGMGVGMKGAGQPGGAR